MPCSFLDLGKEDPRVGPGSVGPRTCRDRTLYRGKVLATGASGVGEVVGLRERAGGGSGAAGESVYAWRPSGDLGPGVRPGSVTRPGGGPRITRSPPTETTEGPGLNPDGPRPRRGVEPGPAALSTRRRSRRPGPCQRGRPTSASTAGGRGGSGRRRVRKRGRRGVGPRSGSGGVEPRRARGGPSTARAGRERGGGGGGERHERPLTSGAGGADPGHPVHPRLLHWGFDSVRHPQVSINLLHAENPTNVHRHLKILIFSFFHKY